MMELFILLTTVMLQLKKPVMQQLVIIKQIMMVERFT